MIIRPFCFSLVIWVNGIMTCADALTTPSFDWVPLGSLPENRADLTSTLVPKESSDSGESGGVDIFLMGGCASNYVKVEGSSDYTCTDVSDKVWLYNPEVGTYVEMAKMPRPRYRHSATLVWDDNIWVIGGRNEKDEVIDTVDVYSISLNTWETIGRFKLPFSDHGAFFVDLEGFTSLCVIGGWYQDYVLRTETQCIDVVESTLEHIIGSCGTDCIIFNDERREQMLDARARITAAVSDDHRHVFIAGGFKGYEDETYCPETSRNVEIYHAHNPSWSYSTDLMPVRGGVTTECIGDWLFAVGGESYLDCENSITEPYGKVEVMSVTSRDSRWMRLPDVEIPVSRFGSSVDKATKSLYFFGGRGAYDDKCDCFPVANRVYQLVASQIPSTTTTEVPFPEETMTTDPPRPDEVADKVEKLISSVGLSILLDPFEDVDAESFTEGDESDLLKMVVNVTSRILCEDTNLSVVSLLDGTNGETICQAEYHGNSRRLQSLDDGESGVDGSTPAQPGLFPINSGAITSNSSTDITVEFTSAQVKASQGALPGTNRQMEWLSFFLNYTVATDEGTELSDAAGNNGGGASLEKSASGGEETSVQAQYASTFTEVDDEVKLALKKRIEDGTLLEALQQHDERILAVATPGEEVKAFSAYIGTDSEEKGIYRQPGGLYDTVEPAPMHPIRIFGLILLLSTLAVTSFMFCLASRRSKNKILAQKKKPSLCTDEGLNFILDTTSKTQTMQQQGLTTTCVL